MATVNIVLANVGGQGTGGRYPAYIGAGARAENLTSSATAAAATITAGSSQMARITATGGAVYAVSGTSPVAVTGEGFLILDGTTLDLALNKGETISVVD